MKTKNRYKTIALGFMLLVAGIITPEILCSQINHGLYFVENIPQNAQLNPAFIGDEGFFIGFPVLNRIDNEIRNGFKYDDYFVSRDDSLYRNPTKLMSVLDDQNFASENTTINILYFGFKKGKNSFRFGISVRSSFYARYSKNLISLALLGNSSFVGKTTAFTGNSLVYNLYQEYSFSYSRQITPKLSIGITPKFLTGDFNAQIQPADFVLYIDENTYAHSGTAHVHINTASSAQSVSQFRDELSRISWLQFSNNLGYAFDMGINYEINSKIELSASLLDVGKIKWNKNPKNYHFDTDSAVFNGLQLDNIYDKKIYTGDITTKLVDDFTESFDMKESENFYFTPLIPKFLLSCSYSFLTKNRVGGLFYAEFFDKKTIPSFSVNYLRKLGSVVTIGVNYNNFNFKAHNLGLSFVLHAGVLQFYVSTNNIIGLISPDHTNVYQVSFGVNFLFSAWK